MFNEHPVIISLSVRVGVNVIYGSLKCEGRPVQRRGTSLQEEVGEELNIQIC